MTTAQTQIQDQLQRKHEELQHLIVQQQEELRRVSEQLLMARYGLLSPLTPLVNASSTLASYASTSTAISNRIVGTIPNQQLLAGSMIQINQPIVAPQIYPPPSHSHHEHHYQNAIDNPVQSGGGEIIPYIHMERQQQQQIVNELDSMPYQMSQEQAQILFASNLSSPNSTQWLIENDFLIGGRLISKRIVDLIEPRKKKE